MTAPTVSTDTEALYGTLPQYVTEQDAAQPVLPAVQPFGQPLLCWLEGMGSQLQAIDNIVRDQDGAPGWSQLLDVTRCPTAYLPWLAQFVGTRFTSAQLTDASQRAAIEAPGNFARGSIGGILAAVAALLTTTSGVVFNERDANVSFYVDYTYADLDASYANYSAVDSAFATYGVFPTSMEETTDAYHLTIEVPAANIASITYGQLAAQYATYAAVDAAFAHYSAFPANESSVTAVLLAALPAGIVGVVSFI